MKKIIRILLVMISIGSFANAQDATITRKKQYNLDDGLAIQGYDPVAYIIQNKAQKGNKDQAFYHQGVTYYFTSAANKEEFKKNPSRYEPEYGGWCAYAMGEKGEKVSVDPKTFKIIGGKLYLFYNKYFNNTLTDWNKDESNLKRKADANWQKFYK
jgi:YHS domain-containing protein